MTQIICHRRNKIQELIDTPTQCGVEIDVRSSGSKLYLHHDPFVDGDDLREWIRHYKHGTLILNVKEEGLEKELASLMKTHGITNYFFLDVSFPFLLKCSDQGVSQIAARYSPLESLETVINIKDRVSWVWIDYQNGYPLSTASYAQLKATKLKLCLVSPELVTGKAEDIKVAIDFLSKNNFKIDAVCTKLPQQWQDFLV